MPVSNLRLFSGTSNPELAKEIADYMGIKLIDALITQFADGEIFVKINENVRGKDVFVVQPTNNPGHKNLMELLIMIDALKRASASRITAVIPYFGYARQDRKAEPRVPITAKLVANLLTVAGADRILTMDLHAAQIQGFFDIPVDHLYAFPVFLDYLKETVKDFKDFVVVSPDMGGAERARFLAGHINCGMAIIDKRRTGKNVAEVMHLIGDVKNKKAIIIDDIVDTAGTAVKAAKKLKDEGATEVWFLATHPVLSPPAIERLSGPEINKIIVSNTIPLPPEKQIEKITVLSVAPLFAEAIERIHMNRSVSSLFVKKV